MRIRENLLDFDLEGQFDINETPHTLPAGDRSDVCRHQNAVVKRLQTHIHMHGFAFACSNNGVAPTFGRCHIDDTFAHLAWATDEVDDVLRKRSLFRVGHPSSLVTASCAYAQRMLRAPVATSAL